MYSISLLSPVHRVSKSNEVTFANDLENLLKSLGISPSTTLNSCGFVNLYGTSHLPVSFSRVTHCSGTYFEKKGLSMFDPFSVGSHFGCSEACEVLRVLIVGYVLHFLESKGHVLSLVRRFHV